MKLFSIVATLVVALTLSGCAVLESPYSCGYYGCSQQQRERGAVAAAQQGKAAIDYVTAENLMPSHLRNCATGPTNMAVAGTNGSYDVTYNASQSCEPQKTRQGGVERPQGLDGISLEECVAMNFGPPQCAKYGRPVAAGGTR